MIYVYKVSWVVYDLWAAKSDRKTMITPREAEKIIGEVLDELLDSEVTDGIMNEVRDIPLLSFCAQWNWLVEHQPARYTDIPEEHRE